MAAEKIRESVIAGTWYPADPGALKRQISEYLDRAAPPSIEGSLIGLIAPHAGCMYSGPVAAYAYKLLLQDPFDRVLILAPSHQASFPGSSIYNLGGYRTPFGVVPLDHEIIGDLYKYTSLLRYVPQADQVEHSLEIQLPYLQTVLPSFTLVPIVMGTQRLDYCAQLAEAISSVCEGKRVLLVASTDLSHYFPYEEARRLDGTFLDRFSAFDPEGLASELQSQKCQACGAGPVLTLMMAARKLGADSAKVLHYANSGDVTGDKSSGVVGYAAAALCRKSAGQAAGRGNPRKAGVDLGFSDEEKKQLKDLALQVIRSRCMGEKMPDLPIPAEHFAEPRAAFVCIHKGADLRGCIGMIEARAPLWETIKKMAVEAAFGDPRFCALAPEELKEIDIEISVLTPMQRISEPSEIEIGKHGLFIRKGFQSGLLLPQVAVEHGWDRKEFLQWTCRKAGLSKNAWQGRDIQIFVFSADVF